MKNKLIKKFTYSFLYDYNRERVKKIIVVFFGIVGFSWTLVEVFSWIFENTQYPGTLRSIIKSNLNYFAIAFTFLSIYINKKKHSIKKTFSNTDLTVIVEFCDIFDQDGAIIIPVSDTFDTDISNGLVNPKTIHGQFIQKYYYANIPTLNNEIQLKLNSVGAMPIENNVNLKGNKDRYPIGSSCPIKTHGKYFYLSSLTYMKDTGNVDMQPQYIYDFLSNVWNFIPNHGEYHEVVNIPVIATGLNRLPANYTRQFILLEIINSFFVTSKVQTFCKTLKICLNLNDYEYYDFENVNILLCHIDNYLNR